MRGRVLITGLGGTVGPALRDALEAAGRACAGWDRAAVSPDDPAGARAHLDALDPAAVCHLALGAEAWAAELAAWCARRGRPFLFTSTAMVFHHEPGGPHRPDDPRTAQDDYGRYKARCEDAVRAADPAAIVARLGWQIGTRRGGNSMLEALHRRAEAGGPQESRARRRGAGPAGDEVSAEVAARRGSERGSSPADHTDGVLRASTRWIPAASFLEDTAAALRALLDAGAGGTFHVDGNADDAWDFHRLVLALRDRLGDPAWRVEPCEDLVNDQRLLDDRVRVGPLSARL